MRNKEVKGVALMAWVLACSACSLPATEMVVEPIDPARKLIGTVQGAGAVSPLLGSDVLVEGVVVRNLMGDSDDVGQEMKETLGEGAGSAGPPIGWFIQDEGDGNPATSDGVFVADQGYDTSINMPADAEYTMRLGSRVRTGDRVTVRGRVIELPQAQVADQPRSTGHPVSRGDADGSVTAIAAMSVTLVAPAERASPITVLPASAVSEATEAMRR